MNMMQRTSWVVGQIIDRDGDYYFIIQKSGKFCHWFIILFLIEINDFIITNVYWYFILASVIIILFIQIISFLSFLRPKIKNGKTNNFVYRPPPSASTGMRQAYKFMEFKQFNYFTKNFNNSYLNYKLEKQFMKFQLNCQFL